MAVVKVIESDGQQMKLFINANDRIALMIYENDDIANSAVIELDHQDVRELIRQCRAILKKD